MADIDTFLKRLDEQVLQARTRVEQKQAELQQSYEARKQRYQKFLKVMDDLRGVAMPRLEKLGEHCKFEATPLEDADGKSVVLNVQTPVARVRLRLAATHDTEVRNLVLSYDLEILPIFIQFNSHSEIQIPLEKVDRTAVEAWLDDRLIEFARRSSPFISPINTKKTTWSSTRSPTSVSRKYSRNRLSKGGKDALFHQ